MADVNSSLVQQNNLTNWVLEITLNFPDRMYVVMFHYKTRLILYASFNSDIQNVELRDRYETSVNPRDLLLIHYMTNLLQRRRATKKGTTFCSGY
jgi:hypothetical protein